MYTERLVNLYINKSKLNLGWDKSSSLNYETKVGDIAKMVDIDDAQLANLSNWCKPDFSIIGQLIKYNQPPSNPIYIIGNKSLRTHTLYITGVKLGSNLNNFRLPNVEFSSYWEDRVGNDIGYLFQVVKN